MSEINSDYGPVINYGSKSDEELADEYARQWDCYGHMEQPYCSGYLSACEIKNKIIAEKEKRIEELNQQNVILTNALIRIVDFEKCENHFMTYTSSTAKKALEAIKE